MASIRRTELILFLRRTFFTLHTEDNGVKRSLGSHLIGVYDLLVSAGCDIDVCTAGALHSVYGTSSFRKITIIPSPENRNLLRMRFGLRAEKLAYFFHACHRRTPNNIEDGVLFDRNNRHLLQGVTYADVQSLRLIEAANILDQAPMQHLYSRFPNIYQCWSMQFQLMSHQKSIRYLAPKNTETKSLSCYSDSTTGSEKRENKNNAPKSVKVLRLMVYQHESGENDRKNREKYGGKNEIDDTGIEVLVPLRNASDLDYLYRTLCDILDENGRKVPKELSRDDQAVRNAPGVDAAGVGSDSAGTNTDCVNSNSNNNDNINNYSNNYYSVNNNSKKDNVTENNQGDSNNDRLLQHQKQIKLLQEEQIKLKEGWAKQDIQQALLIEEWKKQGDLTEEHEIQMGGWRKQEEQRREQIENWGKQYEQQQHSQQQTPITQANGQHSQQQEQQQQQQRNYPHPHHPTPPPSQSPPSQSPPPLSNNPPPTAPRPLRWMIVFTLRGEADIGMPWTPLWMLSRYLNCCCTEEIKAKPTEKHNSSFLRKNEKNKKYGKFMNDFPNGISVKEIDREMKQRKRFWQSFMLKEDIALEIDIKYLKPNSTNRIGDNGDNDISNIYRDLHAVSKFLFQTRDGPPSIPFHAVQACKYMESGSKFRDVESGSKFRNMESGSKVCAVSLIIDSLRSFGYAIISVDKKSEKIISNAYSSILKFYETFSLIEKRKMFEKFDGDRYVGFAKDLGREWLQLRVRYNEDGSSDVPLLWPVCGDSGGNGDTTNNSSNNRNSTNNDNDTIKNTTDNNPNKIPNSAPFTTTDIAHLTSAVKLLTHCAEEILDEIGARMNIGTRTYVRSLYRGNNIPGEHGEYGGYGDRRGMGEGKQGGERGGGRGGLGPSVCRQFVYLDQGGIEKKESKENSGQNHAHKNQNGGEIKDMTIKTDQKEEKGEGEVHKEKIERKEVNSDVNMEINGNSPTTTSRPVRAVRTFSPASASGAHADIGLLTLSPSSTIPALSLLHPSTHCVLHPERDLRSNEWILFAGEQLSFLTGGRVQAPIHSVPFIDRFSLGSGGSGGSGDSGGDNSNDKSNVDSNGNINNNNNTSTVPPLRRSMPLFLRAHPDAILHPRHRDENYRNSGNNGDNINNRNNGNNRSIDANGKDGNNGDKRDEKKEKKEKESKEKEAPKEVTEEGKGIIEDIKIVKVHDNNNNYNKLITTFVPMRNKKEISGEILEGKDEKYEEKNENNSTKIGGKDRQERKRDEKEDKKVDTKTNQGEEGGKEGGKDKGKNRGKERGKDEEKERGKEGGAFILSPLAMSARRFTESRLQTLRPWRMGGGGGDF